MTRYVSNYYLHLPAQVDYTVIHLDEEFAIEYDCSTMLGVFTNYCIHIMARHPQADPAKVQELLAFAVDQLGLNTDNLPFQKTKQDGCWWGDIALYRSLWSVSRTNCTVTVVLEGWDTYEYPTKFCNCLAYLPNSSCPCQSVSFVEPT